MPFRHNSSHSLPLSLSPSHHHRARLKALLVISQTSRCEAFDAARCNYIHFALKMTNLSLNDVNETAIDGIAYDFGEIVSVVYENIQVMVRRTHFRTQHTLNAKLVAAASVRDGEIILVVSHVYHNIWLLTYPNNFAAYERIISLNNVLVTFMKA